MRFLGVRVEGFERQSAFGKLGGRTVDDRLTATAKGLRNRGAF